MIGTVLAACLVKQSKLRIVRSIDFLLESFVQGLYLLPRQEPPRSITVLDDTFGLIGFGNNYDVGTGQTPVKSNLWGGSACLPGQLFQNIHRLTSSQEGFGDKTTSIQWGVGYDGNLVLLRKGIATLRS